MFRKSVVVACLATGLLSSCQSGLFPKSFQQTVGYRDGGARENPADETSDPWIHEAGTVARTEHPTEEVYDPLKLRNVFMSQKARDIERNLGIGD